MKRLTMVLAILLVFALTPMALGQMPSAATITVEGKLINANNGQLATADLPLMLHTYEDGQMAGLQDEVPRPAQNFEAGEPEQALFLATAQLDEAYQAGLIPEERYRLERAELLAQLKALLAS